MDQRRAARCSPPIDVFSRPSPNDSWTARFQALPKAELHVHLEGTMQPDTVVALAKNCGDRLDEHTVAARYASRDFAGFIEAYKWVTSYLRAPADYAFAASRMCEQMLAQKIVYAEVTLSVGVMLLRKQDAAANFHAICEAVTPYASRGLRLQWIFDAVRQFGAAAAREVAQRAVEMRHSGVIAFGMGGDELAIPAADFRHVYDYAACNHLHRLVHAGEIGRSDSVREAVETLGAERIGHGISAANDPNLMSTLAERSIHLEVCPTSNLRTGALARCVTRSDAEMADHPLPKLLRAGIPISISTDDPAIFSTDLADEFGSLGQMGLERQRILRIAETAFLGAFLPDADKSALLKSFRSEAAALGLL
ncbi:MAG TPA: adenosine deaminase [Candidatus Acidoferrales bacterium]|nr:adenosine deaminase [Candidatus Acidoferrales bacterium]